jgi:hypothetical protein
MASSAHIRTAIASREPIKPAKTIEPFIFNPKKYVTKDLKVAFIKAHLYIKENDILQLKQVFDLYDSEMAGMLSPNDLKCLLCDNGFRATKETLYGTC